MATDRKILQWLEKELFEGKLVLGQELPSERAISAAVGATRNATHEALKSLESRGILRLYEGGRRHEMIAQLVREPAASAGPALKLHMATAQYPLRDIVHTRVLLETWALRRADNEHAALDELVNIMDAMDQDEISLRDFLQLDVSFHVALTRLSGNSLVTGLLSSLRESIYEYEMSLVGYVPLWSATATRLRAEHRAIHAALSSGDNELAARMVAEHIEGHYLEAGVDPDRKQRSSATVFMEPETDQDGEVRPLTGDSALSRDAADRKDADQDLSGHAPGEDVGFYTVDGEAADAAHPEEDAELEPPRDEPRQQATHGGFRDENLEDEDFHEEEYPADDEPWDEEDHDVPFVDPERDGGYEFVGSEPAEASQGEAAPRGPRRGVFDRMRRSR